MERIQNRDKWELFWSLWKAAIESGDYEGNFIDWLSYFHPEITLPGGPLYYDSQPLDATSGFNLSGASFGLGNKGRRKVAPDATASPANGVMPFGYGREKIPVVGFTYLKVISGYLCGIWPLCEGEVESISDVELNGEPITNFKYYIVETYKGTMDQAVCGLQSFDATWTDRLPGTAYIFLRIMQQEGLSDLPSLKATVELLKVYDHRIDPTLTSKFYSTNPALHAADHKINHRYGEDIDKTEIDWDSVDEAANNNDTLISGLKKFEFNYLFSEPTDSDDVQNIILSHFMGGWQFEAGKWKMVYGKPRSISVSFTEDKVFGLSFPPIGSEDIANRIEWQWMNSTTWELVDESVEDPAIVENGDRAQTRRFDFSGSHYLSQSSRLAIGQLNMRLSDMLCVFLTYNSEGLQPWDVFQLTHTLGTTNKQFFATTVKLLPDGSWLIAGREYDPAFFSEIVITEPTYPDTTLPLPTDVPTEASGLTLTETLIALKSSIYISVTKISWTASVWPFIDHYEVWAKVDAGDYELMGITTGTTYELRAVEELAQYTVKIVTVSTYKVSSSGITGTITPQGKYIVPVWKGGAALTANWTGEIVKLSWYMVDRTRPAIDIDIIGYELRRGRTTDTWDSASTVNPLVDTLSYQDKTCPAGTWRYFLKARDSVGNETATAITTDVTVVLSPYAGTSDDYVVDLEGASLTDTIVEDVSGDDWTYPTLGQTWAQRFDTAKAWNDGTQTYPLSTYAKWLTPTITAGTQVTDCVRIDLGQILSGTFSLSYDSVKIGAGVATLTPKARFSTDDVAWSAWQDISSPINTTARYVDVKFEFTSSDDTTYYIVKEEVAINILKSPLEDFGEASIGSAGSITIPFAVSFSTITKVKLTAKYMNDTLDPRKPVYALSSAAALEILLYDKNNFPADGDVMWQVEGY